MRDREHKDPLTEMRRRILSMIRQNMRFPLSALVVVLISIPGAVCAETLPAQWPWKGITVAATAAVPGDVFLLKKKLGVNSLRLELNVRLLAQRHNMKPDAAWEQVLDWADHMLDACRQAKIAGIISISQFPIDPALNINQESPHFWNSGARLSETLRLVGQMSGRFTKRGSEFVAYEILSEPLIREGESVNVPSAWRDFQTDLVATIRRNDTARYIIINPPPGGSPHAYRNFRPISGTRIMYGAHMYLPHSFTHQGIGGMKMGYTYPGMASWSYWDKRALEEALAALRRFQLQYDVPVWIGEFSAVRWAPGAEQYLKDLTSIFKAYGWGWAYHAYQEYHGWNPDYDTSFATDAPDDWKKHYVGDRSVRWQTLKELVGN